MNKSIIAIVLSVVAVVASITAVISHPATVSPVQHLAGGTSPEISSPYLIVNGITEWYFSKPFATGTTTLCSFPAPTTGSSTIQLISFKNTSASSSAFTISIGTSTNAVSTSSLLVSGVVAANSTSTPVGWLSTTFAASSISGGQYLNVVSDSLTTDNGYCQVEFTQN